MMRRNLSRWALGVVLLCLCGCAAQPTKPTPQQISDALYADWKAVLDKSVTSDGSVRWDLIQNDDQLKGKLQQFIGLIGIISPDDRPDLFATNADRQAYWINVYNALAMFDVVQHDYPDKVDPAIFTSDTFVVGGSHFTLDEIEKSKLAGFGDARIAAALNQCCRSSPPLRNEPYVGASLDSQLADQVTRVLKKPIPPMGFGDAGYDRTLNRPPG